MGSTVTAKFPFAGKNQLMLISEEASFGASVTHMPADPTDGPKAWKNIGYVTGGSTSEARTIEEIATIGHRNIQQLAEIKFEPSGSVNMEYQTGRIFFYAISSNNGTATNSGIAHDTVTTGLYRHIIYEPELNSGVWAADAIADIPSFNLLDGYTRAGTSQPKVARKYLGCKIDSLNVNFTRDGTVKIDMNWKGAQVNVSQATSNYSTAVTESGYVGLTDYISYEEVFPPVFGKVYFASMEYGTSAGQMPNTGTTPPAWNATSNTALAAPGNQLGDVQSANINISHNLESFFVIGDVSARAIVPQQRKYEGKISMAFENEAMHLKFLGEYVNTYASDPVPSISLSGTATVTFVSGTNYTCTPAPGPTGWTTNNLTGATVTDSGGATYIVVTNSTTVITAMTLMNGTATTGSQAYTVGNIGTGSWDNPWFMGDRQKYKAMKLFYDNSSLGYGTASSSYRRIEITLLGVKFKATTLSKQVSGIIYQDFEYQALMLAPYDATDHVGGITVIDGMSKTDFDST